jgi:hypothetical protein|tara:strand:+ start:97 stop:276 length:180 start_codon:yes stop_codon:yes gene_type:complete
MSEIRGSSSSEILTGAGEPDRIITNGGKDAVYAGGGNDEINGLPFNCEKCLSSGGFAHF